MNRQKLIFFLVVGLAVILVSVASTSRVREWLGPPNLEVTATVVALRSTEVAIAVTESAIQGTVTPEAPVPGVLSGERTWNGLRIEVVDVQEDGWPLVRAHNQFNEPPKPGKRMLLITVKVSSVEGAGAAPIAVGEADFKVVGERGIVYNTYSEETRCGVVPDALDGVVADGHSMSGAICVQVPEEEKGFVLIYEPYVGDQPAVYIPLPEGE